MAITDARPEVDRRDGATASQEGITSFKVFMAYKGALMVDDEQFLAVLEQTGKTGGLVMVHCENGDAVVRYQKEAMAAGNTDPKYHAWSRPPEVEGEATGRAIRLAEWTKRPLFVVHVTCEEAVREIRAARDRGLPIFGETCIQYLYLTVDDLDRPGFEGAKYVCSPPLREERNQAVLYQALRQGALQGISTDHCPFNFNEQKELGLGRLHEDPERAAGDRAPADAALRPLGARRATWRSSTSCATARGARRGSSGWTARARSRPASTPTSSSSTPRSSTRSRPRRTS